MSRDGKKCTGFFDCGRIGDTGFVNSGTIEYSGFSDSGTAGATGFVGSGRMGVHGYLDNHDWFPGLIAFFEGNKKSYESRVSPSSNSRTWTG